jgi:hypothetical protein
MRFDRSTLQVEGHPIVWITAGGHEIPGTVRFTRAGKMRAVLNTANGRVEAIGDKIPPFWAPAHMASWPAPLPTPVDDAIDASKYNVEDSDGHGWPYPDVRLGRPDEPPESHRECDARILRCIRTARVLEYEPAPQECLWPPSLMIAAKTIERALRGSRDPRMSGWTAADYADYHIDPTDLRPLPARWMPTPRDVSDYEQRPNPLTWIPPHWHRIYAWRAALPPYTWEMIAERCGSRLNPMPVEALLMQFNGAMDQAMQRAKRGGA